MLFFLQSVNDVPWFCLITTTALQLISYGECDGYGFVYSHFSGPVSGPVEEIISPMYADSLDEDQEVLPPSRVNYVVGFLFK